MVVTNPSTAGGLSQLKTVVELLYKLCCDIPQWGLKNLMAMVVWLESCADNAVAVSLILHKYQTKVKVKHWYMSL
jgi:hypothetical protein